VAAAVVQAQAGTGASVSWANAESGVKFNLADSITDTTTPISVPTATGTVFSWLKNLALAVTSTGTTAMTNRRVAMSGALPTGLSLWFKDVAQASYAQAASGNRPTASGSNGATPSGYTAVTTSNQQWDNTSHATSGSGPNGDMCVMVMGVDNTYTGGAGNAVSLGNILLTYDEA